MAHSVTGVMNRLSDKISSLPMKEQKKVIKVVQALIEEGAVLKT